MAASREQLEESIAGLEAQRQTLGDAVVGPAIEALKVQLAALSGKEGVTAVPTRPEVTILWVGTDMGEEGETSEADWEYRLQELRERLIAVVGAQGGELLQEEGDKMMAVWGLRGHRGDDEERAVRAALGLKALVADEEKQWQASAEVAPALSLRIGIHTGLCYLDVDGDKIKGLVEGETTEKAKKIFMLSGGVWPAISLATYQHIRGVFDVHADEVDGELIYFVEKAKPRAFPMTTRVVEGVATRMVGREIELEMMQKGMVGAMKEKMGGVVTVVGEAGLGKSRLLYEFDEWVELQPEDIFYYKGRAQPGMEYIPLAFWRDVIKFRFQIRDSDTTETVWGKMEKGIKSLLGDTPESERQAHIIGQMLGFDFTMSPHVEPLFEKPAEIQMWGYKYLAHYLVMMSDVDPTLILLEDIHWADDASLDFLQYVASYTNLHSLLLVCVARPSLLERFPNWFKEPDNHIRIDLRPLSLDESRELIEEILQKAETIPTGLVDKLINRAGGNPFYIEEVIKLLVDRDLINKDGDVWQWREGVEEVELPQSMSNLLEQRLALLTVGEGDVLRQAAVVGRVFWDALLAYMRRAQGGKGEEEVQPLFEVVEALQAAEFIYIRDMPAFFDAHEYIFTHILVQEAAYDGLTVTEQKTAHSHVADWLLMRTESRLDEWAGLIGYHLVQAGRVGEAAHYFYMASQHAQTMGCLRAAVTFLEDAKALLNEGSPLYHQIEAAWQELSGEKAEGDGD
ncbi:MAG TPA: AAA family ATPase [Anaerolineae bacterium]|nr:AAA family ATPase [Anaerolineae bacterium]